MNLLNKSKKEYDEKKKKINELLKNHIQKITEINNSKIFYLKNKPYPLKENYNSIIPLKTFTCWHKKNLPPKMLENYNMMKQSNPEFEHFLFDENECRDFIRNNFSKDVLCAYDSLIPCAFKSDLWRYCVLYKYGGIYFDIKYRTVNGFKLIALTENEYFVRDLFTSFNAVYNAFMVVLPNNKIMMDCINKIVYNVKNKYYGNNCLEPTGPVLLASFFSQEDKNNLKLYLETFKYSNLIDTFYICYGNHIILGKYKEYYDEQNVTKKNLRYPELWDKKKIYSV